MAAPKDQKHVQSKIMVYYSDTNFIPEFTEKELPLIAT